LPSCTTHLAAQFVQRGHAGPRPDARDWGVRRLECVADADGTEVRDDAYRDGIGGDAIGTAIPPLEIVKQARRSGRLSRGVDDALLAASMR
jgi:hypothetical protein